MPGVSEPAELLEASVEIAAAPGRVWALVSDLRNIARWSPQVVRTFAFGPVKLGTRLLNINRDGVKVWPTSAKVVEYRAGSRIAFQIVDNRAIWSFQVTPTRTGTTVVQRREAPAGLTRFSRAMINWFVGGHRAFEATLVEGMNQTLGRIKAESERPSGQ